MSAYMIARLDITDQEKLAAYRKVTPAIVAKYNGKFIARASSVETLEGEEESRRVVIVEFPSMEDAKTFYHSAEYKEAIKIREGGAVTQFILVDGL